METNKNISENTSSKTAAHLLRDSVEEFEFRPITEGLGFNRNAEKKGEQRIKGFNSTEPLPGEKISIDNSFPMGDLTPFYKQTPNSSNKNKVAINEKLAEVSTSKPVKKKEESLVLANRYELLLSWLIDMAICLSLVALTATFLVFASGVSSELILKILSVNTVVTYLTFLLLSFYICYFSFLDTFCDGTFGKFALNLRITSEGKSSVSFKGALFRAMISFCSLFAFGLPLILNFQGMISGTRILKKNNV